MQIECGWLSGGREGKRGTRERERDPFFPLKRVHRSRTLLMSIFGSETEGIITHASRDPSVLAICYFLLKEPCLELKTPFLCNAGVLTLLRPLLKKRPLKPRAPASLPLPLRRPSCLPIESFNKKARPCLEKQAPAPTPTTPLAAT